MDIFFNKYIYFFFIYMFFFMSNYGLFSIKWPICTVCHCLYSKLKVIVSITCIFGFILYRLYLLGLVRHPYLSSLEDSFGTILFKGPILYTFLEFYFRF